MVAISGFSVAKAEPIVQAGGAGTRVCKLRISPVAIICSPHHRYRTGKRDPGRSEGTFRISRLVLSS